MDTSTVLNLLRSDPAANVANNLLQQAGGTVYVVGGAVRDVSLGMIPKDIDLMVTGLNGDQIVAALDGQGRLDFTGKAFGVYRFKVQGSEVEIAMPRVEYGDTNKDYTINENIPIEDDLRRRDFTANAMAINTATGELVDPYNGQQDLQLGSLETVSPTSFKDDPTRILRALTAVSRFGLTPGDMTYEQMQDEAHTLASQPPERLQMELDKILTGADPASAFALAAKTGVLDYLLPEVSSTMGFDQRNPHHDLDVGTHMLKALSAMTQISSDPDLRMAALLHDIGKPNSFWQDEDAPEGGGGHFYKKIMPDGSTKGEDHEELGAQYADALLGRLRYPNDRRSRIVFLVRNHMFPYFKNIKGARRFLQMCAGDPKVAFDLLKVRQADASGKKTGSMNQFDSDMVKLDTELVQQAIEESQATTVRDLAINGNDLIQMGVKPGPEIGRVLNDLLEVVIENPDENNPQTLMELARGFLAPRSSKVAGDYDEFSDAIYNQMQYGDSQGEQSKSNPVADKYLDSLPDYKWSWNGEHLDVWPTKDWEAETHFQRTGPGFYDLAQGRIYKDSRGKIEIHVWSDRGTEFLREQAVEEVEAWLVRNLGQESDIVTYESDFNPEDAWLKAWKDRTVNLDEDEGGRGKSIHDMTDDEWEHFMQD